MGDEPNKALPKAGGDGPILLAPATYEALRKSAERPVVVLDPRYFDSSMRGGRIFYTLKGRTGETSGPRSGAGRFVVSYAGDAEGGRLYVSPGSAATGPDPDDDVIRPRLGAINGDELTLDPPPFFDCAGLSGEHEVIVAFNDTKVELQLWKDGEVVDGFNLDTEEEEENGSPNYFLLATVSFTEGDDGPAALVSPVWESDIAWSPEGSSSGSESSDSGPESSGSEPSEPSSPSEPSDGGESEKSTAIVPAAWTKGGYTALYALEAPDVRFEDVVRCRLKKTVTRLKLDPRFVAVCEPDTIAVVALVPERPMSLGAKVAGGYVVITRPARSKECEVTVTVSGIRKGFAGRRWPDHDRAFFEANERFLKSARPKRPEKS